MATHIPIRQKPFGLFSILFFLLIFFAIAHAAPPSVELSKGQTVYVPVYSHIYGGNHENPVYLAVTLSIRNTDIRNAVTITRADYFDSNGTLVKKYLEAPKVLDALSSTRYVIKESDKSGGSGASFIVQWESKVPVNPPVVESVMIGTRSALGISFNSRGQVLH